MNRIEKFGLIIEDYTDMPYFDEIISYFDEHHKDVLDFFKISSLKNNWVIQFLPYDEFKKQVIRLHGKCESYVRGLTTKEEKMVRALNVEDSIKYTTHKDADILDICKMIIHEYSHACYSELMPNFLLWFSEGLAQNLANQDTKIPDISEDDFTIMIKQFNNYSSKSYMYSYCVVKYIFEHYPEEEIYKLTFDRDYLISRTRDIFDETKVWIKEEYQKREKK